MLCFHLIPFQMCIWEPSKNLDFGDRFHGLYKLPYTTSKTHFHALGIDTHRFRNVLRKRLSYQTCRDHLTLCIYSHVKKIATFCIPFLYDILVENRTPSKISFDNECTITHATVEEQIYKLVDWSKTYCLRVWQCLICLKWMKIKYFTIKTENSVPIAYLGGKGLSPTLPCTMNWWHPQAF